jgi:hypothetical protein
MIFWTTKDGVEIPISSMTTAHIEKCIKFMERSGNMQSMYDAFDEDGKPWTDSALYEALIEELEARKK